jgi:hypothetical protein
VWILEQVFGSQPSCHVPSEEDHLYSCTEANETTTPELLAFLSGALELVELLHACEKINEIIM